MAPSTRQSFRSKIARFALVAGAGYVAACSAGGGEPTDAQRQSILNGDPIGSDLEALLNPAVSVRTFTGPDLSTLKGFGAGILLAPNVVLTAAHVITGDPEANFLIVQGNSSGEARAKVKGRFHRMNDVPDPRDPRKRISADLGIVFTQTSFSPSIDFPDLECDSGPPSELVCTSGTIHKHFPGAQDIDTQVGTVNFADPFKLRDIEVEPWKVSYSPTKSSKTGLIQTTADGDSGMGCLENDLFPLGANLSVIQTDSNGLFSSVDPKDPKRVKIFTPEIGVGFGVRVHFFCDWIKKTMAGGGDTTAFYQQADSDQTADLAALSRVAGDTYALEVNSSKSGSSTSFTTTIAGSPDIAGATFGKFSGTRPSILASANGTLTAVPFNDGPTPTLSGVPSTDYTTLIKAKLNGDSFDDLVASRGDGTLDAFLGGSTGLTFNANIHPVPLRLDKDSVIDFAWLTGGAGISTTSSLFGQSHRDVVGDGINLSALSAGLFHRETGDNVGIRDVVTLGKDVAGGGVVIWCKGNGNSTECKPALDARFATGRDPNGFQIHDLNGDGRDDLVIEYSNHEPRVLLSLPSGFKPIAPNSAPAETFADGIPLNPIASPDPGGFIAFNDEGGLLQIAFFDPDGNEFGPVSTPFTFNDDFRALAANFNDDGSVPAAAASALAAGELPFQDVVVLNGGQIIAFISNGDGTFTINELDAPPNTVDIQTGDVTGDGVDDLQALLADGSVTVFPGVAGSSDGLGPASDNFTGLPTPDSEDGKMLLLSGLGVDTVGATEARFRISVDASADAAALDHLTVQIFDGDNGGLHQFDNETKVLKTCYRLSADPCGDGNSGSCAGGPTTPIEIVTLSSDAFGDDVWDTLYAGPHSADASIAGDGAPPYNYELRVFLSEDCSTLPTPGDTIEVATADAFKVRANGMLSMPAGEFSLIGSDAAGEFGLLDLPYMRDTNYDGTFDLAIAVGSSATEIQLKEADADDTTDSTPGVSLGANAGIQYRLLDPNGNPATVVGAENGSPTALVTNPSGNNDGLTDLDVETRIHTITTPAPGTWIWRWENVSAANAFHVFTPFGSPTTHEVLGARRVRPRLTNAEQPYFWQGDDVALASALPVVLGERLADGSLQGASFEIATVDRAKAVLDNSGGTLAGELERQLLVAKLNAVYSREKGEDLRGALVYGTTTSVRRTLLEADSAVAGSDLFPSDDKTRRLVTLLSSVNLGEVTYQQPGVPFPDEPMADLDVDGIIDVKDNCPTVANPGQEDADDNRIGDACNVSPLLDCVLHRTPDMLTAFFEYENPLSFRSIAVGSRNGVASSAGLLDFAQPSEFSGGRRPAFNADFGLGESVSWALEGSTVSADQQSAACSGRELTFVGFAPQTAVFGSEGVTIGDHVSVRAKTGLASVLSGGVANLGGDSTVGHLFARAHTALAAHAKVQGTLVTGDTIENMGAASVTGSMREHAVVPAHSIAWWIDFGGKSRARAELDVNEVRTLPPGLYGDVVVPAGAVLNLQPGRYQFDSLSVAETGAVSVEAGPAELQVAHALTHRGSTRVKSGAGVVLGYLGTETATIAASFRGTVVAPNAALTIGTVRNSVYTGAFFARTVDVRPSSVVEYEAQ